MKVAFLVVGAAATEGTKDFARGFVRMPRNAVVEVAEISDEMRAAAPTSLDWSAQGATTAVKDQGYCGSCWAFSATEGIESGLFMAGQQIEELSTQQIVACDKTDGGCDGGDLPTAFDYVKGAGGIDSASDYADTSSAQGQSGTCNTKKAKHHVAQVTGYKYGIAPCTSGSCTNQDESGLMAAMAKHGPLSVCVNAQSWSPYTGGVYSASCSGGYYDLDHCVQLVGYDSTGSEPYWKVRNSWASTWGEGGYIRLAMGINQCGIADEAMFVTASLSAEDITV